MKEGNLLSLSYGRIVRKDATSNDGLLPESFETYQIVNPSDVVLRLTDLQNDKRSLRSAIVTERGIITSAYIAVTPVLHDPRYLAYLMRSYDGAKVFYAMGGGLRQSMKFDDMRHLPLVLPSADEQRDIGNYLDVQTAKIDALIGKQERLIETLAERRQAVITRAVTKGLHPDVPMVDSGVPWLGSVPRHWSVEAIKRRGMTGAGTGFPHEFQGREDEKYPFHKVNVLARADVDGVIRVRSDTVSTATATLLRASIYPAGSLIMAKIGAALLLGRIRILGTPACIDNNLMAVQVKRDIEPRFLFWALNLIQFDWLVNPGAVPSTSEGAVGNYKLAFPGVEEQRYVAEYLDRETSQIDALAAKAREMIVVLKERRQALISAVVTGKIDVRGLA
ncbi:MAG TPA: hypothetical protein VIL55_04135 [Naasia sp.]|jgi:type I restriction enzyme S subunit